MSEPVATETFRCPRCGRDVPVTDPDGEPLVTLTALRFFHARRRDATSTTEPAGTLVTTVCLRCDTGLWDALQEVLPRKREGAEHGD